MILYVGISAIFGLILAPLAANTGLVPPFVGLAIFAAAGFVGAVVLFWGVISWIRGKSVRSLVAAALGLPCVASLVIPILMGLQYPSINDVSTDLRDPPKLANEASYPEGFKSTVAESYPDVETIISKEVPAGLFERALAVAKEQSNWELTRIDRDGLRFEGVATTRMFRFKDDFTVRIRPKGSGAVMDMRSRSRVGKGDLGSNARRIRRFLEHFR